MKRFLALTLLFLFLAISGGAQSPQPPAGFAGDVYGSTFALYGTYKGATHFTCTTQPYEKIVGGYHLITAGHCVQSIPAGVQFSITDQIGGNLVPVKLIKAYYGGGIDFAEFELKTDDVYTVIPLGDENEIQVGEPVINANFALGIVKQLGLGFVSSAHIPASAICDMDTCVGDYLVQIYGAGGSSGSAVISTRTHKIIGLAVGAFSAPVGLSVEPISWFKKFLAGPNQPHPTEEK